jgi:hypothetical protein
VTKGSTESETKVEATMSFITTCEHHDHAVVTAVLYYTPTMSKTHNITYPHTLYHQLGSESTSIVHHKLSIKHHAVPDTQKELKDLHLIKYILSFFLERTNHYFFQNLLVTHTTWEGFHEVGGPGARIIRANLETGFCKLSVLLVTVHPECDHTVSAP